MDTARTNFTTALRWLVGLSTPSLCVALVASVLSPAHIRNDTLHLLGLIIVALSTSAWVLVPTGSGAFISIVALVCLLWAWAARGTGLLGMDIAALLVLLGVVVLQRRRRMRQLQQMEQKLDDLGEERTVKDQAMTLAHQTQDALQKKVTRYTQLQSIAEELSNMTDLSAIAQLAIERAFELIGKSDACLLFLVDREQQELSLFTSKKRDTIPSIRAKHGDQFDRYVLRTHRPLLVNDVRRDFRFTVSVSPERTVSSVIACPLLLGQSPEGVLRLDSARAGAYTQDDLRFLDILLDLVSTAMTNAKLFAQTQQLAITDGLTGLALRRPFLEQLTRELVRSDRSHEPVSVVMLDVDHFKAYNDAFGHSAGDLILQSVAQVLRDVVPPGGMVARYGGEEFAALLPRFARHQASEIAERIRQLVEQHVPSSRHSAASAIGVGASDPMRYNLGGESRRGSALSHVEKVTVSLGVATFPEDAQAELEILRIADQRLYAAKHAGRNLVVCS